MPPPDRILIVQTAFLGDVILALPLVRALRGAAPGAVIDIVVAPRAAPVLEGDPDLGETIVYDKHGADAGLGGFRRIRRRLRQGGYGWAVVPHRSIRSALLAATAGIPARVGFDRSAGRRLFTAVVPYQKNLHEVDRNLSLLGPLGLPFRRNESSAGAPPLLPVLDHRSREAEEFLRGAFGPGEQGTIVTIAPGTPWATKRWPADRFAALAAGLAARGHRVVVLGGREDAALCREVAGASGGGARVADAGGRLPIRAAAELIRRCALLIGNDSAPLHLAAGVGTPAIAIFGATVPEFGFGPAGSAGRVVELGGLWCRPCSAHGGRRCPVGSFDCMTGIGVPRVLETASEMLSAGGNG